MSFDRHHDRDPDRRQPQRNSWTDIAYLIVAAAGLVLGVRLYSRAIHPWALHVVAALTWQDALPWAVVLMLNLVAAIRAWATRRRRLSARGRRVVDPSRHTRATDPMASGEKSSAQGPGPGSPKAITQ